MENLRIKVSKTLIKPLILMNYMVFSKIPLVFSKIFIRDPEGGNAHREIRKGMVKINTKLLLHPD